MANDTRPGRPKKKEGLLHKIKRNVRLMLDMDKKLAEISGHTGIPVETLLRSYANEGIRKDYERIFDGKRLAA